MTRQSKSIDEEAPFIKEGGNASVAGSASRLRRWISNPVLPWTLVIMLSTFTIISHVPSLKRTSTELWTSTDFIPGRQAIAETKVKFSSSLDWLDPDHIYRISDPTQPVYIGNDTENIDREWHSIIYPADLSVTDEEAKLVDGELGRSLVSGKYKIELEVFHSLHCLNMIRKRVYSDKYPEMLTDNARIHVDHCIDSLRELIMCEGNLTPIPLEWSARGQRLNPNYATTHSCRDFDKLKEFAIEFDKRNV